ncbi:hypothetical protein CCHOA_07170 [Corynebacterium choanae]|uniref:Uncharacterized protein n=1 Tax=Corynebacterium choanae TaxID=1862358 RepID=A0A3G6J771_9CORY|nr:hypothetical protein CCHOA_07170 [Corynebacterium choanae]
MALRTQAKPKGAWQLPFLLELIPTLGVAVAGRRILLQARTSPCGEMSAPG